MNYISKLLQNQTNKQNQMPRQNSGTNTLPVTFGPISASLQTVSEIFSAAVCVLWKRRDVLSVQISRENRAFMKRDTRGLLPSNTDQPRFTASTDTVHWQPQAGPGCCAVQLQGAHRTQCEWGPPELCPSRTEPR